MDTAQVNLKINGEQAEEVMDALYTKAAKLKQKLEDAWKVGDPKSIKTAENAFKKATKEVTKLEKQLFSVDKVLKNLSSASIKNLTKAQKELNRALSSGAVARNSKDYKVLVNKLRLVDAELRKVRTQVKATNSFMSRLGVAFNTYFTLAATAFATLYGMVFKMRQAVEVANEFESSVANLSALTGLAGKKLDWLTERALAFSGSVTESGIRVTNSALDIVNAYTQMGSKRPELLKDKEALAQVTEQAIILSNAAKMELVPATNSLATSLNQFNADASQAARFINVIAAGSKAGAGDVSYQARALEKAGTAIKLSGQDIEQGIALIETIAPYFSQPTRAGTQLKNVMLRLQMTTDAYNPKIVGMAKALNNLAAANLTVTDLTKLFGTENLNVGQILIENRGEYQRYLQAITDTDVATQQATINTATNTARLQARRQELNKNVIILGQKLAPLLTFSTSSFSWFIKAMTASMKFFAQNAKAIAILSVAITTYTLLLKGSIIYDKLKVFWNKKVALSFKNMYKAMAANPYAAIVAVVLALITALALLAKKHKDVNAGAKALADAGKKAKENTLNERVEIERLLRILENENTTKEQKLRIYERLNVISPEYFGNLDNEATNTDNARIAAEKYITSLNKLAKVEAAKEMSIDIEQEAVDLNDGQDKEVLPGFWQYVHSLIASGGNAYKAIERATQHYTDNAAAKLAELKLKRQALQDFLDENVDYTVPVIDNGFDLTGDPTADKELEYQKLSDLLKKANKVELNLLKEQYLAKELTKIEFTKNSLLQNNAYQESQRLVNLKYKKEVTDIDSKILQNKMTLFDNEVKARKRTTKALENVNKKHREYERKQEEEDAKRKQQLLKEALQYYEAFQSTFNDTISGMVEGNEDALKEGSRNMILIMLDFLKAQMEIAIAGVTIQGLASLDPTAAWKALGKIVAIEAAFAAVKGLVNYSFDKSYSSSSSTDTYTPSSYSNGSNYAATGGANTSNVIYNTNQGQSTKSQNTTTSTSFDNNSNPVSPISSSLSQSQTQQMLNLLQKLDKTLQTPLEVKSVSFPMHDFNKANIKYIEIENNVKRT